MTALLLSSAESDAMLAAVHDCYAARQMAPYWLPRPVPVLRGPHEGLMAVDLGPEALAMVMRAGVTLGALPDFASVMASMGNPGTVEVDDADLAPLTSPGI